MHIAKKKIEISFINSLILRLSHKVHESFSTTPSSPTWPSLPCYQKKGNAPTIFYWNLYFKHSRSKTWLASKAGKPSKPVVKLPVQKHLYPIPLHPFLNPLREHAVLLLMMSHRMLMRRISANCFKTTKISYHLAQPGTLDRVYPWKYSWHSDFWNWLKQVWCTHHATYLHTGNYLAVYYTLLSATEYQYRKIMF